MSSSTVVYLYVLENKQKTHTKTTTEKKNPTHLQPAY